MYKSEEWFQRCIQSLVHACQCRDANCRRLSCHKMKRVVQHTKTCKKRQQANCPVCKQLIALCCYHAKHCNGAQCQVSLVVGRGIGPSPESRPFALCSTSVGQCWLKNGSLYRLDKKMSGVIRIPLAESSTNTPFFDSSISDQFSSSFDSCLCVYYVNTV